MKNAGKACNNRLYRHIRTFEKIIKNYFVIYLNFIGKFDVPVQPVELSPEEQKRQEALKKRRIHQRNKRAQARQERMNAQLKNKSPI